MKIFSVCSRARGPAARPRRNFSATRRFTGCFSRRASSSRGSSSRAAALTGWPSPPNGRPRDSNFPRRIWNGSPPRPAASSNCRTPAGWNWTPTPCRARTRRWPRWAWKVSSPCRKKSAWNTSRIWTKASCRGSLIRRRRRHCASASPNSGAFRPSNCPRDCRPTCARIKRTASISSATSRKSGSAASSPTTWVSAKRSRPSRGWRGSRSRTKKITSRRSSSARRPCCTTGSARRNDSRRA